MTWETTTKIMTVVSRIQLNILTECWTTTNFLSYFCFITQETEKQGVSLPRVSPVSTHDMPFITRGEEGSLVFSGNSKRDAQLEKWLPHWTRSWVYIIIRRQTVNQSLQTGMKLRERNKSSLIPVHLFLGSSSIITREQLQWHQLPNGIREAIMCVIGILRAVFSLYY